MGSHVFFKRPRLGWSWSLEKEILIFLKCLKLLRILRNLHVWLLTSILWRSFKTIKHQLFPDKISDAFLCRQDLFDTFCLNKSILEKFLAKDKTEVDQLHSASDNWVQLMEGQSGFCRDQVESVVVCMILFSRCRLIVPPKDIFKVFKRHSEKKHVDWK